MALIVLLSTGTVASKHLVTAHHSSAGRAEAVPTPESCKN
jgi:hypothetical protein